MHQFIRRLLAPVALVAAAARSTGRLGGAAGSGIKRVARGVAIAAMLAVGAVVFVPAPAQAGGDYIQICLPDDDDDPLTRDCFWIMVFKFERDLWPDPGECPECWPALDFWRYDVDPVARGEFDQYFGKGLGYLAEAALTEDEKLAEQLRAEATELLIGAAKVIDKYEVSLDRLGWLDVESGKFYSEPSPQPMIDAAKSIVEGFALLDKALDDPTPQPNLKAAMERFDASVVHLNELAAGGKL